MHVCFEDWKDFFPPILLCLEFKTKTKLVTASVDVFAIK